MPSLFQKLTRAENSGMLDGSGHNVSAFSIRFQLEGCAQDGHRGAFGAAAGKNDFVGSGANQSGDPFPRLIHGLANTSPGSVNAGGIREALLQIGEHRLHNLRMHRRGGCVVKVNTFKVHVDNHIGDL